MLIESNFVKHEPCPKCGSKDNLARYDDGHAYCFGCGHREPPTKIPSSSKRETREAEEGPRALPEDVRPAFASRAVAWLSNYGITKEEIQLHGLLWSDSKQYLIFPFRDSSGSIQGWQARNFGDGPKYVTYAKDVLHIIPQRKDSTSIVLVEDIVSAIKVSRVKDAMPILGSVISTTTLHRLQKLGYKHVIIWLDNNKLNEAAKGAARARMLGLSTQLIHTERDPKEYSAQDIGDRIYRV